MLTKGEIFLGNTLEYRNEERVVRAIRALIHGRVQGVFFRAYTRDKAHELNLVGWVRNKRDGTVECQVQGPDLAIEKFIQFLHHGSPAARVDHVAISNVEFNPRLRDFKIMF
ncbi:MAG: acylphosphatase [Promethearchaeota archaeon]